MAIVGACSLMTALGASATNVAGPSMRAHFDLTLGETGWIVTAYLLAVCVFLPPIGRLGDTFGASRVLATGLGLFATAQLACVLAPTFSTLVLARIVQGVGAAMMMAMGPALLAVAFAPGERGRALGIQGTMTYVGLALGPTLGGALVESFGFRAAFAINLPLAVVVFVAAMALLPRAQPQRRSSPSVRSTAVFGLALATLLIVASRGERWGWLSLRTLALTVLTLALAVAVVRMERTSLAPLTARSLWQSASGRAGVLAALLAYMATATLSFTLPFFLQGTMTRTPKEVGLIMTAQPMAMAVVSPWAGAYSDRAGSRVPVTAGMLLVAFGCVVIGAAGEGMGLVLFGLVLVGAGAGLFTAPNNSALLSLARPEEQGAAAATLALARNMGMALGVAVAGALLSLTVFRVALLVPTAMALVAAYLASRQRGRF